MGLVRDRRGRDRAGSSVTSPSPPRSPPFEKGAPQPRLLGKTGGSWCGFQALGQPVRGRGLDGAHLPLPPQPQQLGLPGRGCRGALPVPGVMSEQNLPRLGGLSEGPAGGQGRAWCPPTLGALLSASRLWGPQSPLPSQPASHHVLQLCPTPLGTTRGAFRLQHGPTEWCPSLSY